MNWPIAITAMKISPTMSMPITILFPSSSAGMISNRRRSIAGTLTDPREVSLQRALDFGLPGRGPRDGEQLDGVRLLAEDGPRLVQHARPQARGAGRPGRSVVAPPLGPHLCADRDQLGKIGHRLDDLPLRNAHESVRVQIVAEQEGRIRVGRLEEPRPAIVEQVALVDRLEAEPVLLHGQHGEDGLALLQLGWPERRLPERALARGAR